jgi:ribosomal protein S18 acetylase RimI-like enzyme
VAKVLVAWSSTISRRELSLPMSQPPEIQRPPNARPRGEDDLPAAPDAAEAAGIEQAQARLVELGGARRTTSTELAATFLEWPGRGPAFNHATCLRWTGDDWRHRAGEIAARLQARGEAPCLIVSDGLASPPDLAERLASDGWFAIGHERVLWTRRAAAVPHLVGDLRLESVTTARVDEYEAVERQIFGISEREAADRRAALAAAIESGVVRVYLVRETGVPVATARLLVEDGLAAIHGLGVVATERRRGLGRYLTTIATRAGLALGASLVWLSVDVENPAARALYDGLDYRPIYDWRRFLRTG